LGWGCGLLLGCWGMCRWVSGGFVRGGGFLCCGFFGLCCFGCGWWCCGGGCFAAGERCCESLR
ncbi:hypothetical protein, partial [Pseudomonas syringae group genomosp. 7]|uniref:hypothetical protein n=1 Tax=Pseudomonas syringae group genomosp. 7 TaxID=251699 RepID=UPI00376FFDF0